MIRPQRFPPALPTPSHPLPFPLNACWRICFANRFWGAEILARYL